MFHGTSPLQKRIEQRLRGFRAPSTRILRKAIAGIDRAALVKPFGVPHIQPPSNLSISGAWKLLNVPLTTIIKHQQDKNPRWKCLNITWTSDAAMWTGGMYCTFELITNHTFYLSWSFRLNQTHPDLLTYVQPVKPSTLSAHEQCLALQTEREHNTSKVNAPRYKPPATFYWVHCVYRYNKSTLKTLPITAENTRKLFSAYFNLLPNGFQNVVRALRGTGPNVLKAFVSDGRANNLSVRQELIGKISHRKNAFWRPFRYLIEHQPRIVFKHYPKETRIMAFVYDRRIEVLKQMLSKLSRLLRKTRPCD